MHVYRNILLAAFALTLAACTQMTLVKPGEATVGSLKVTPSISWNELKLRRNTVWTVDGTSLQAMYFVTGVEDDETLIAAGGERKLPKFRADMTAIEVADLFKTTLVNGKSREVNIRNLRPARFAGVDGFRFEFDYRTEGGLDKLGMAVGAIRDRKLTLIFYHGTRLHYFDAYKHEAERIIASALFS